MWPSRRWPGPSPRSGSCAARTCAATSGAHAEVLELPLVLAAWEPAYALATYRPDEREVPDPGAEAVDMVAGRAEPGPVLERPDVTRALTDLVEVWTSESGGEARAVVVAGGPAEAVAALGHPEHRLGRVDAGLGMARMAWAAASGGAHGVRRGAALGRFDAWWAAAGLAGLDWPPDPGGLGAAVERLAWWVWDDGMPGTGWILRLVAADPAPAGPPPSTPPTTASRPSYGVLRRRPVAPPAPRTEHDLEEP